MRRMREEGRISAFEAMVYQISIVLATAVFFVPGTMAMKARQDAWLSGILACLFGFLVAVVAAKLALRFPQQTVVEYAPRLLGSFLGKLVGFVYVFYFFYGGYYVIRQFGELMATSYYPHTPLIVFTIILTLLACYVIYLGIEVLCRVILIWGAFAPIFFVLLLLLVKDIELSHFLPVLENGISPVLVGAIAPGAWFGQTAVVLVLLPFISDKRRAVRTSLAAVFGLFVLVEIVLIAAVGVVGAETVARLLFPLFTLFRRIHLETLPVLDRQDAIFMMMWVGGMLLNLATFFHAGMVGLGQWLGLKSHRPLIFPVGALLVALAIQSWGSIVSLDAFSIEVFPLSTILVNLVLTAFLFLVAVMRGMQDGPLAGGGKRAPALNKKA